ncbi:SusC/RagA family TonB-linked outer membrane protein [Rhizosphaericola mali]|uniref:SusC/RagA family TonB-linked outer membrane protein n=1 Tax=Rhizosphaericola mali TaxID=2545455 RepID=A0A5P2G183_9BACT|nr:SusC/RagA family TonB-linked outer membrane protein [Rhizosphaericola mali]QES89566.1 SusC/RagA family TonB-linked outer membrane protein [Rhizosphaericola mali]
MWIKNCRWLLMLMAMFMMVCGYAQQIKTVTGSVSDEKGTPVEGVSIRVTNGKALGMTDTKGSFSVKIGTTVSSLTFSSVGYAEQKVAVSGDFLKVTMLTKSDSAEEVVVTTSFGIKKQARSLGYAVSTVSAKDLTESGATNIGSALYGKAAGVKIVQAPGGASSAVSVQVRGVSSIGLNTQPLYVVDGVPIRLYNDLQGNLGTNANNGGFWSQPRVQSNGVLDINPEDIASLTILKGASASALYGSEAANGVVVITTKKGSSSRGLGVDFNEVLNTEKVAYGPDYQNEYGPGQSAFSMLNNNVTIDGETYDPTTGFFTNNTTGAQHPYYNTYSQFGPKFDGRDVTYWDGTTRKYSANKNNYMDFFQSGYNSNANIAVSNASDKGSYRFSYTRMDYKGIMPGSKLNKNNFNFNGTLKLSDRVSLDVVSSFNNNYTHNRPYMLGQIFGSYSGFFSRMDDMNTFKNLYKTSDGYKYVGYTTNPQYDESEVFKYATNATNILDYYWNAYSNSYDEHQNRFINSVTLNVAFSDHLRFRGRVGGDFTSFNSEEKDANTIPNSLGNSGTYAITTNTYNIFYGDGTLTYNNKIGNDLDFTIMGGASGRKQIYKSLYSTTNTGLGTEDWYSLNNSLSAVTSSTNNGNQLDIASFGTIDLNYKGLIYLEGTGRYEATSTLPSNANNYFYPSVNGSFILSDAVKLPKFFNYAKIRASYGLVGNHPNIYQANVAYTQNTLNYNSSNVLYQYMVGSTFGNNNIKSEKKREAEFGLETRVLNNKLGIDLSFYTNKVSNQILTISVPSSSGALAYLANAGDLANYGYEAALNYSAITTRNFSWTTRFNFAINKNKLTSLPNGQTNLINNSFDGGYAIIRSSVNDALGNIYVHPKATDGNGNAIIDDNGYYTVNTSDYQKVGNIMPKMVGGFSNSFKYKGFGLDFTIDYRLGGNMISIPTYYQMGAGMYKSTLQYRDAAHGGIAYNVESSTTGYTNVANDNGTYHDGLILKGVTSSGATNTKVISAEQYYSNTYNWETAGLYENAVFKNSYIKFRELTFSYNLPKTFTQKIHFQNLQFALIGRNLFYIWKTLPHGIDPEAGVGSSWMSQGVDIGAAAPTRSYGISLRASF